MEDKENILNTFSTDGDNLAVVQAKYEVKTSPEKYFQTYLTRLILQTENRGSTHLGETNVPIPRDFSNLFNP